MRRSSWILFMVMAVGGGGASAQSDPCAGAETQADINECVGQTYQKADAQLNAAYKKVAARLRADESQHKRLVAAQREWIKFRDAECAFATANSDGGSAHSMALAACLTELTQQRANQLDKYLQCPEGDLGCPISEP